MLGPGRAVSVQARCAVKGFIEVHYSESGGSNVLAVDGIARFTEGVSYMGERHTIIAMKDGYRVEVKESIATVRALIEEAQ